MTSLFESTAALSFRRAVYGFLRGFNIFFPCRRNRLVVFSYHSIANDNWRFSVDPETFRRQIETLLSRYRSVSLSEAGEFFCGERVFDAPSFVLTFDDGYRDILGVKDFLAERGIRPAFFVLSDSERANPEELGTRREFLSDEEIRSLVREGWELGCHSATHGDFRSMRSEEIRKETIDAKKTLEERLGVPVRFFAYPRGRYTDEAKRFVRDAGYELALSMDDGFLSPKTDRFAVPRIGVDRTHSRREFDTIHADAAIFFRKFAKRFIGKFL